MSQITDLCKTIEVQTKNVAVCQERVESLTNEVKIAQDHLLQIMIKLQQERINFAQLKDKRDENLRLVQGLIKIHLGELNLPLGGIDGEG